MKVTQMRMVVSMEDLLQFTTYEGWKPRSSTRVKLLKVGKVWLAAFSIAIEKQITQNNFINYCIWNFARF